MSGDLEISLIFFQKSFSFLGINFYLFPPHKSKWITHATLVHSHNDDYDKSTASNPSQMSSREAVECSKPHEAKYRYFIATTKFCCNSGTSVAINFDGDSDTIKSNTFYTHSTLDACLIRIEKDLGQNMNEIPCLPTSININRYNGAACWNAGWGTDEVDG